MSTDQFTEEERNAIRVSIGEKFKAYKNNAKFYQWHGYDFLFQYEKIKNAKPGDVIIMNGR